MQTLYIIVISLLSGITASMGLGGGMFLIVYLTALAGLPQTQSQGINLIFFIFTAAVSVLIYTKQQLIDWKKLLPSVLSGVISAIIFSAAANRTDTALTQKFFGCFVLIYGIKTIFSETVTDKKCRYH